MARSSHPFPVQSVLRGTGDFFSQAAPPAGSRAELNCLNGGVPRAYRTYGEWFEDQQAPNEMQEPEHQTVSSGFWPYGKNVTDITSRDGKLDYYKLDGRYVLNSVPSMKRSSSTPGGLLPGRGPPSSELLCSHAEARQGQPEMHASASWYRSGYDGRGQLPLGSPARSGNPSDRGGPSPAASSRSGTGGRSLGEVEAGSRRSSSTPFRTLSTAHPVGHEWRLPGAPAAGGSRRSSSGCRR